MRRIARSTLLSSLLLSSTLGSSLLAQEDFVTIPPHAVLSESGLTSLVVEEGAGERYPGPRDRVQVRYIGRRLDGQVFMDSRASTRASIMDLTQVFPGWREGLLGMVEGEHVRLWIPPELGPPGETETAVFDVELLQIFQGPPRPDEIATPTADAEKTPNGAFTRLLRAGTGTEKGGPGKAFLLHYTGWTSDGEEFDSTLRRRKPTAFLLDNVMKPFGDCLQQMVEGELRRCWVPGELAKGNWIDSPEGDLTFDIELLNLLDANQVHRELGRAAQGG